VAAALLALATGGCASVAAAGVVVVGLGAAYLALGCDDPIGLDVRDRNTGHLVCDAKVVAESEGNKVPFSPCYRTYLSEGTWKVTAWKEGYLPAEGLVIVTRGKKCEPAYHSLELTLVPEGQAPIGAAAEPRTPPGYVPAPATVPPQGPPPGPPAPATPAGSGAPPQPAPPQPAPPAAAPTAPAPARASTGPFPSAPVR